MKKLLSLLCLLFRHFWRLNCSFLPDFIQKNLFKICLKNYLFVSISLFGFQWSFFFTFVSNLTTWCAQVDSNHRPRDYQARALTCWAMSPFKLPCISSIFSPFCEAFASGGDDGIRTHDPLLAGQVLSQLSYTPIYGVIPLSEQSLKIEQQWDPYQALAVHSLAVFIFGFGLFPKLSTDHTLCVYLLRSP